MQPDLTPCPGAPLPALSAPPAQPGLFVCPPDPDGRRPVEWFGEPIGMLHFEGRRWSGQLHARDGSRETGSMDAPLDAAAALLGAWVRVRGLAL